MNSQVDWDIVPAQMNTRSRLLSNTPSSGYAGIGKQVRMEDVAAFIQNFYGSCVFSTTREKHAVLFSFTAV